MPSRPRRFEVYGDFADRLTKTCLQSIDEDGFSTMGAAHGTPSIGHVAYVLGELHRCRPAVDITSVHGCNLVSLMRTMIERNLDLDNEIHRCFLAMGLGMMGPADEDHIVLKGIRDEQRKLIHDGLVVTREFDNNWEAFNGSILVGRHMLYGDPADGMLDHFEKIASKYDETGYFDDTLNLGNYNNYGLMSINYPLRAVEYLEEGHPVRNAIECRFKDHALRYVDLILAMTSPHGDTWPFGRSAGVLGQLQCIALMEQCLSKQWIEPEYVNQLRATARQAMKRMRDLYWDESLQWFNFRDEFQTAYDYRASLPMAWDILRYFLQIEAYASKDEQSGIPQQELPTQHNSRHQEIVTHPGLKTAVYVWSDGSDHAVLPIMAGSHQITGDTMPRPYAQGLFEWTTQHAVPALCPRLTINGENYWPAWRAERTELATEGEKKIYRVEFDPLYSDGGVACPHAIACETKYVFSSGQFERIDLWSLQQEIELDGYSLEVLQPSRHPWRPNFGEVKQLTVTWKSEIEAIRLTGTTDVSRDPVYRNYHGHASHSWKINSGHISLREGTYITTLRLRW